ncbi:hypothetical protein Tco_0614851 [Tanacetum coccineum]
MSLKGAEEVSTESDSNDETTHVPRSMVESSKKKELKSAIKKIEKEAKAKAARREGEMRKEELIDLLGPEVVSKLNDLENKKRKHADDIHDFFRANKRLKSSVQYEDHPASTVLNEPVLEIFFRLHQGPGLDDHARTFSSLLLAEIDKRNLNPLKQMRFESLKFLQRQLFRSLEDWEVSSLQCMQRLMMNSLQKKHQAIQTILTGLPKDIYAVVDSCNSTKEIWLHVQQMMKGESIESHYHLFRKLMNDLDRNQLAPKNIACVTLVHQTKKLHEVDYNQLYDYLKQNLDEVNEVRAERLSRTHDPLAFTENTQTLYSYPLFHPDQSSNITYMQHLQPNNNYAQQPPFNMNNIQQPMKNSKDILDPTTVINMALVLMAKAFKLNYITPTNNNYKKSSKPRNRQISQQGMNMGQDRQMQMVKGIQMGQNAKNLIEYNTGQIARNQIGHNGVEN